MWFDGYQDAPDRTAQRLSPDGRWYLTGDAGMRDDDGYFFFSSHDDDIIIMSGYRVGPFEIESVLSAHPAVLESAVSETPDELRGQVVEAYVVLAGNYTGNAALVTELQHLVKNRYAAHAFPRRIHFVESLPKTSSGKVQCYVLRKERKQLGEHGDQR
ncbi:AMP-binding protein [Pseudarthrobacter sp. fls2-241-R2A-168]|uniref:AMP-binding enzyme n=1 Tax=Pseudarthrobacter sp. fls2-241-R2A-168 TaxID=3040304 RepID=UPI0025523468|nr:AMP-binding protein [Pseudarthrobacter sp. fls2-241-R2A-168]